ncbi:hypothetical protein AAVH_37390, partial [Aphelenchoides avenae]
GQLGNAQDTWGNISRPKEYGCVVGVCRYKDAECFDEEASESVTYNRENIRFDEKIWNRLRNSIIVNFRWDTMPFSDAQLVKIRKAIGTNIVVAHAVVHARWLRRATPQGFVRFFIHSFEPKRLDLRMQRGRRLACLEEAKLVSGPRFLVLRDGCPDKPSQSLKEKAGRNVLDVIFQPAESRGMNRFAVRGLFAEPQFVVDLINRFNASSILNHLPQTTIFRLVMPYSKWMPGKWSNRPRKVEFDFERNIQWAED